LINSTIALGAVYGAALDISDIARADRALKGIVGKRLTYQTPRN
jgi:hypothetical protein